MEGLVQVREEEGLQVGRSVVGRRGVGVGEGY